MHYKNKGVTLIEVLITILIISIGLLGVAAMQGIGLKNNYSANVRSQATILAYDIADRVRANPGGAASYDFDAPNVLPNATVGACLSSGGCTTAQMASHDTYEWLQLLEQNLPAGIGTICMDASPDDGTPTNFACSGGGTEFAIKVWWDEGRTGNPANYKRFSTTFRP